MLPLPTAILSKRPLLVYAKTNRISWKCVQKLWFSVESDTGNLHIYCTSEIVETHAFGKANKIVNWAICKLCIVRKSKLMSFFRKLIGNGQMKTNAHFAFRYEVNGEKQWTHSNAYWKCDCERSLTTISTMLYSVNGLLKNSFSTLCLKLHRKFGMPSIQSMHWICFSTFSFNFSRSILLLQSMVWNVRTCCAFRIRF